MAASRAADRRDSDELVEAPPGGGHRSEIDLHPAGVESTAGSDYYRVFLRNLKILIYIIPVEFHGK